MPYRLQLIDFLFADYRIQIQSKSNFSYDTGFLTKDMNTFMNLYRLVVEPIKKREFIITRKLLEDITVYIRASQDQTHL